MKNREPFSDLHHVFHIEKHWISTKEARELRNRYVYNIDRQVHNDIHTYCPPVPLLGYYAIRGILRDTNPTGEPLQDLEELCLAIEATNGHPRAHYIERGLGKLSIESIRLQIPFFAAPSKL